MSQDRYPGHAMFRDFPGSAPDVAMICERDLPILHYTIVGSAPDAAIMCGRDVLWGAKTGLKQRYREVRRDVEISTLTWPLVGSALLSVLRKEYHGR